MRTREAIREAKRLGKDAGSAAASCVFDGNTTDETRARVLKGIEDGDPEILDSLRTPNLSGEFAGDPTPKSLAEDIGLDDDDPRDWLLDEVCETWENAAYSTFWLEVEKSARA